MRALLPCFAALAVFVQAPPALAQPPINIFPNPVQADGTVGPTDFSACQTSVTLLFGGVVAKFAFSIYASTSEAAAAGISGAEFYVPGLEDLPSSWMTTVVVSPEVNVYRGHPTQPHLEDGQTIRRLNVAWPSCQQDEWVFLARVECQSLAPVDAIPPTLLSVVAGDPPTSPTFPCPLVTLCDPPSYTMVCARGGSLILNPPIAGYVEAPDPPDGATEVARDVVLGFDFFPGVTCVLDAYNVLVKFGTDPGQLQTVYDPLCCPPGCSGSTQEVRLCWSPGLLQPYTTYYWQAGRMGSLAFLGPLWQFTTGATVATTHVPWSTVKQLYR